MIIKRNDDNFYFNLSSGLYVQLNNTDRSSFYWFLTHQ